MFLTVCRGLPASEAATGQHLLQKSDICSKNFVEGAHPEAHNTSRPNGNIVIVCRFLESIRHAAGSSSRAFASFRSIVSKPSVNVS